ncbi:hypothetical protein NC652_014035 [Populus alba x Populus x berolinensis]|nr:hypothetical protein NC652_014035 [Populus alba x Populus x berolinensis]
MGSGQRGKKKWRLRLKRETMGMWASLLEKDEEIGEDGEATVVEESEGGISGWVLGIEMEKADQEV